MIRIANMVGENIQRLRCLGSTIETFSCLLEAVLTLSSYKPKSLATTRAIKSHSNNNLLHSLLHAGICAIVRTMHCGGSCRAIRGMILTATRTNRQRPHEHSFLLYYIHSCWHTRGILFAETNCAVDAHEAGNYRIGTDCVKIRMP